MVQIDIDAVLKSKAPKASRYVPRFVVNYLKRILHVEQINEVIARHWDSAPQTFIHAAFETLGVSYTIQGLDRLPRDGRYLFASNHPFGGMDGMMLADKLIDHFGDARVIVNDLLMHIAPLRPLWVPVNKHGAQSAEYARRFDEVLYGDLPVLTFPAGLCSRRHQGVVSDTPWKPNFVKKAHATHREIVPVFVEGCLSKRFYRLSNLRTRLGIKFNIEMLYLADEMFRQQGQHFRILVGEPIPLSDLHALGSTREQTEYIRHRVYKLGEELHKNGD